MDQPATSRRAQVQAFLRQEYAADETQLEELFLALVLNLEEIGNTCRGALRTGLWDEVARAGHSLKGVGGNINQDDLRLTGMALEEAAKSMNPDQALRLLAKLDSITKELLAG